MTDQRKMSQHWIYPFSPLSSGRLLKRYKRFLADIELDSGEVITAHCPNTGPMTGVCQVGSRVMVSHSTNPKRKLAHTWELIEVHDNAPTWVGVNTALPNRVMKSVLDAHLIPELDDYETIRPEVRYGVDQKSRIDFFLSSNPESSHQPSAPSIYVEVKNTTWAKETLALFPDTVTTRGQKHIRELISVRPQSRAVMVYFINRGDCLTFSPGDAADPTYGTLLREAIAQGVEILPCRFDVQPDGIRYLGLAECRL